MKKKVLLMTAIGLILLGAVIAAALNAVFTVTDVIVYSTVISEAGGADALALQSELEEKFVGKSTTFLDLDDVKETVRAYPAFRIESVRKDFPRTVELRIGERRELFSFARAEGGYAILDEEGVYLYDRAENVNRRPGGNVLLEGFSLDATRTGETAEGECFPELLEFISVLRDSLDDVRANVRSVELRPTENQAQGKYFFRVRMTEGVYADVYGLSNRTREKAMAVLATYRDLSDEQKQYGFFDLIDDADGNFKPSEHRDVLPSVD